MENVIDKELMRIPLAYFCETLDNAYNEYVGLLQRRDALLIEKERLENEDIYTSSMLLSRKLAIEKALVKNKTASKQKLIVLNGFMMVTTAMCEDRVKGIEYLIKIHPEKTEGEEELDKLKEEKFGIFDYLAKVEVIKNSFKKESEQVEFNEEDEPSSK